MKNYIEKDSGEMVVVSFGTLMCVATPENMAIVTNWLLAQTNFEMKIRVSYDLLHIDFPDSVPTHMMGSLLEHFEHTKI